ncbi:MAG: prenyltransferase/squalene oxidase repeat-containing protein, partial [Planctomycetia bacterium]
LCCCALAGLVDWREVPALPFELACLPSAWYRRVNLPVVSYALPALIAIGYVRHRKRPSANPVVRGLRSAAVGRALRKLTEVQPASGGFLEATPLTSFVTMSLAGAGRKDHPVVTAGVGFLAASVRPDGSWPIDTHLATWLTTLAVRALGADEIPVEPVRRWLLDQQYTVRHPYTDADPGGWAWTPLSGGVPDADDTPGALLALRLLNPKGRDDRTMTAVRAGVGWLLDLQNRDGGWPTFCRGWGYLPFDRSGADLTAHALRALVAWRDELPTLGGRIDAAVVRGVVYLEQTQRPDGSWLPLWFGCQHAPDDENPTYGTARVLLALVDLRLTSSPQGLMAVDWLTAARNADGGWGGAPETPSTVEETALAVEALAACTLRRGDAGDLPAGSMEGEVAAA